MHGVMMLQARGIAMYNVTGARSRMKTAYDTRMCSTSLRLYRKRDNAPNWGFTKSGRDNEIDLFIDVYLRPAMCFGVIGNVDSERVYRVPGLSQKSAMSTDRAKKDYVAGIEFSLRI